MRVGGGNAAAQSMMTKQRTGSRGAEGLSAAAAFPGNKQRGRVRHKSFQVEIFPEDLHNILGQGVHGELLNWPKAACFLWS
jgi:hypothetical protein